MKRQEVMRVAWEGRLMGDFRVLATWGERLRGLLGTDSTARPVVLVNCRSIHTFGMRYALDVALADGEGRVLVAKRRLQPGRLLGSRRARYAFERPASEEAWPEVGQCLQWECGTEGELEGAVSHGA